MLVQKTQLKYRDRDILLNNHTNLIASTFDAFIRKTVYRQLKNSCQNPLQ